MSFKLAFCALSVKINFKIIVIQILQQVPSARVKVFRINPEFRILRLTFHRKSALKC